MTSWRDLDIEAEKQTPILRAAESISSKFPEALTTIAPKGWYRSQYRVDSGWGCGYRNCQTVISALLEVPEFAQVLPKFVPSIPSIQLLIESAWQNGFDRVGASQLNWELVGTKKWIGGTEIAALFGYLGIKCEVIDFTRPSGRTPSGKPTHAAMVNWVYKYITSTIPFPIYMQFAGHSQTVVGCRPPDKGLFLLDPSSRGPRAEATFLPTPATNHDQYQAVAIVGVLSEWERNNNKEFIHRKIT